MAGAGVTFWLLFSSVQALIALFLYITYLSGDSLLNCPLIPLIPLIRLIRQTDRPHRTLSEGTVPRFGKTVLFLSIGTLPAECPRTML